MHGSNQRDTMAEDAPNDDGRREVGDDAVWSLSSAKPGNGVDQLRDSVFLLHIKVQFVGDTNGKLSRLTDRQYGHVLAVGRNAATPD
ncbi:hypothetical protein DD238_006644 [Peronospora effusa]|uniref:DOC domain-containing protein n=1 Tax=Peronospora effusa TaxID=542832 RepID=A0A3M6VB05_9STRA|nr:hypothetical protein DD238_006644 [Peronospora effusa]RQM13890.1 hypothetical protein DD237_005547 [Peronospora effusa]